MCVLLHHHFCAIQALFRCSQPNQSTISNRQQASLYSQACVGCSRSLLSLSPRCPAVGVAMLRELPMASIRRVALSVLRLSKIQDLLRNVSAPPGRRVGEAKDIMPRKNARATGRCGVGPGSVQQPCVCDDEIPCPHGHVERALSFPEDLSIVLGVLCCDLRGVGVRKKIVQRVPVPVRPPEHCGRAIKPTQRRTSATRLTE